MLTQAVIQSSSPMTLNVENADPDEIIILKSISGLSNPKAVLFLGEFAREGGYYQGRRAQPLNPVLNLKLNPDYALDVQVNEIREMLYRMFMEPTATSDAVQILLKDDKLPDRYFDGYTEDIDTDMFIKDQTASVSMITTDPYLRSAAETTAVSAGGWFSVPLTYDGTADTGFEVTIKVLVACTAINLLNNGKAINLTGNFAVNDVITINTNKGKRAILKNGVDMMTSLATTSSWLQLAQAGNNLEANGGAAGDNKVGITMYKYRSAWWGI